ncbi:hypothetical protein APS67_000864 [Streptomyces sp. AVP053U2]|nr:hypothetical protein APS67_000864 [Streptomyces sp. AVP053U2]
MLRGLLRAAPGCEALPVLREALVDGAVSDPHREHLRCRGYRLDPPYGPPVTRAHLRFNQSSQRRLVGSTVAAR